MRRLRGWWGSIRTRVVVGYVLLLLVALFVTAVIARGALLARFENDVDDGLAEEVDQLLAVIREGDPDTGRPFTDAEELFDTHLRRVLPGDDSAFYTLVDGVPFNFSFDAPADLLADPDLVADWAATTSSTFETRSTEAGRARTLVVPVQLADTSGTFVVATFTDDGRTRLDDVFRTLLLVATVVLALSALVAMTVANRIVRPIRSFTEVARSVSDADLSARVPEPARDDEVAELASTFNAMMSRLEEGFASQRRFLDDVAHELRTPITIIQGHLDVLGDDPDERAETVALLTDELERMNRYVDDLLVLAQAERPDFLRPAPVDLDEFADAVLARVVGLADRSWQVDAPERTGRTVHVDEQRLVQAVLNLVQNAIRHTGPGDEIGLGVACDDAEVRLHVRDTGPGIAPEVAARLFDRHVRSAASRSAGGVGLGLSIVDAIVTAHHGHVTVASSPGAGATFTLHLPLVVPGPDDDAPTR